MSLSKVPDELFATHTETTEKDSHIEHVDNVGYFDDDDFTTYPNAWSRYRLMFREYVAEFLGVCILILFGNGVNCQVTLSANTGVAASQQGSYLSISFGWAIGTAMGVWVSGGISGGHINPAVTIALATYRGFPWKKVPGYILAQVLGGAVGAALVYADYYHAINVFEDGRRTLATAGLFSTYALAYMPNVACFFSEFLATAVLMVMIMAINDKKNMPVPAGTGPVFLFLLILGLGACLGMETAYALNPARDLGPRITTAIVGYGRQVFNYRNQYWLWCPILGPILGAQAGALFYDVFLYTGDESPINRPNAAARARHARASRNMRKNMPAGPGAEERV